MQDIGTQTESLCCCSTCVISLVDPPTPKSCVAQNLESLFRHSLRASRSMQNSAAVAIRMVRLCLMCEKKPKNAVGAVLHGFCYAGHPRLVTDVIGIGPILKEVSSDDILVGIACVREGRVTEFRPLVEKAASFE